MKAERKFCHTLFLSEEEEKMLQEMFEKYPHVKKYALLQILIKKGIEVIEKEGCDGL